ncbi:MAG: hypothetical protein ACYC6N_21560 [Pirellulaceae bacterium]
MASKRMSLVESMKRDEDQLDPATVDNFLKHGTATPKREEKEDPEPKQAKPETITTSKIAEPQTDAAVMTPGLIPIHVRVRPEIAGALKTAALQRELRGVEPFTKREIVEQALEPWLKKNGYMP